MQKEKGTERIEENTDQELFTFLEHAKRLGATFYVDGEPVSLGEAIKRAVQEESNYMADYVMGEAGNIEEIRFDKVDIV